MAVRITDADMGVFTDFHRPQKLLLQILCVLRSDTQLGLELFRLAPSARVLLIQAVKLKLRKIDDGILPIANLHSLLGPSLL